MRKTQKLISAILAIAMVLCLVPTASLAQGINGDAVNEITFATFSDIHYYPQVLTIDKETGKQSDAWLEAARLDAKEYNESEDILLTALETFKVRAKENNINYLLVPGDITKESEYVAHTEIAKIFEAFEEETGIQVIVVNGNHDINSIKASQFINNVKEPARATTPEDFREIYKNLGYDLATDEYAVETSGDSFVVPQVANALSYTVDLDEKTQLIVVDSCMYSFDGPVKVETGGEISKECLEWIGKKADEATAQGKANILMTHHNVAPHMECEPSVTFAFCLYNYLECAEFFADHNIHYTFSGHLHQADIAKVVSDDGNVVYDVETGALTSFPNTYREQTLTLYENGECEMSFENVDFDSVAQYVHNGKAYAQGEFMKESFGLCFGGGLVENGDGTASAVGFVRGLVENYLAGILREIAEVGILDYIELKLDFDLAQFLADFLEPYIGEGIYVNGYSILSKDNIMWFVEDLCNQIEELYINDPKALWTALEPIVEKLVSFEVSDLPCTELIDEIGIGDPNKPGTLEDLVFTAVYYFYTGNEDISDNAFLLDAIEELSGGERVNELFNFLIDTIYYDIAYGLILDKLEIRLDKLFNSHEISQEAAAGLNKGLSYILKGDFTYGNLVDTVFALGILPYSSVYDILDQKLIQEYWTDSMNEILGSELEFFLRDFATDSDPQFKGDYNVSYVTNNQADTMEISQKNYRLPTMLSVTLGDDAQTQANINWFSKSTLEATDIEIYEGTDKVFTGTMEKNAELVDRYYPGIDLGFIGLFEYHFDMYRHSVKLSGLKPGTSYTYRVGNAERGWWSDWGTITTADGGDEVTFFHMSDPQAKSQEQYERGWANTVAQAFRLYPEADFIMNTGDISDHGNNTRLWQRVFDTPEELPNTFFMPTAGNHEGMDDFALTSNFLLPNVPEQDEASGTYYSFDYNNVHIAVLNSNDIVDDKLSDKQIDWLTKDMNGSNADWKVVSIHKAVYSNGSHYDDDDVIGMREQLGELMPDLDIDIVLQGHDHVYLRTFSLDGNAVVQEAKNYLRYQDEVYKTMINPAGTTYVISGCAGVKYYQVKDVSETDELFPRAAKIYDAFTSMFSSIQIKDGILYFNAYTVDGEEVTCVDSFAIQKDASQGDALDPELWPEEELPQEETEDLIAKIIEVFKKILQVMWNIFNIYFINY